MPHWLRLGRVRRYEVASKTSYVVCAHLLNNTLLECTLSVHSTGLDCLEHIAQRIELNDFKYFGLYYVNKKLQLRWVELEKPLKRQLDKHADSPMLYFSVMHYVPNAHLITDDVTRYHYYLQLKTDVIEGKLTCNKHEAIQLAAYSLQAEFGDYEADKHTIELFKNYILLPKSLNLDDISMSGMLVEVVDFYRTLTSTPKQVAEIQYIVEAQQLDRHGLELYPAKNDKGKDLVLGSSSVGLCMRLPDDKPVVLYKWSEITGMSYNRKQLMILTTNSKKPIHYTMESLDMAKYVHRICYLQQQFYKYNKQLFREDNTTPLQTTLNNQNLSFGGAQTVSNDTATTEDKRELSQARIALSIAQDTQHNEIDDNGGDVQPPSPTVQSDLRDSTRDSSTDQSNDRTDTQQDQSQRQAQLPPYQPAPSYELVMSQQRYQQIQQMNQLNSIVSSGGMNLSQAGVYSHPSVMAYSHPEISVGYNSPGTYIHPPYNRTISNEQQPYQSANFHHHRHDLSLAMMGGAGAGAYHHSILASGGGGGGALTGPGGVTIHPTISMPDLNHNHHYTGLHLDHHHQMLFTSGADLLASSEHDALDTIDNVPSGAHNHMTPFICGPYPKLSSNSTPDLALHTQTPHPDANGSPDLVSHRNLQNSRALDHSIDDLSRIDTSPQGPDHHHHHPHPHPQHVGSVAADHPANVADEAAINEMTSRFMQEVTASMAAAAAANAATEQHLLHHHHDISLASIPPPPQAYQTSVVGVGGAVIDTSEHTYENLPAPVGFGDNSGDIDAQTGFDNPAYGMEPGSSEVMMRDDDSQRDSRASSSSSAHNTDSVHSLQHQHDIDSEHIDMLDRVVSISGGDNASDMSHNASDSGVVTVTHDHSGSMTHHQRTGSESVTHGGMSHQDSGYMARSVSGVVLRTGAAGGTSSAAAGHNGGSNRSSSVASSSVYQSLDKPIPTGGGVQSQRSSLSSAEASSYLYPPDQRDSSLANATMAGLSLSRASVLEVRTVDTRAPRDERRQALEARLEGGLGREFESVPRRSSRNECQVALKPENAHRNRFKDVQPYDVNRVKLKPTSDNPDGYINASHIKMSIKSETYHYITTQGPTADTAVDLLDTVWQYDVDVIAMLTDTQEEGRQKCYQYWPDATGKSNRLCIGGSSVYEVVLQSVDVSPSYQTRILYITHVPTRQTRQIWHLQYTDWPDHGCPTDTQGFLNYLDETESVCRHLSIERREVKRRPVIVHCSAGVGRSGVFILTQLMKTCLEQNTEVNVCEVLTQLRAQRMYMVQTISQYNLVYKALVQYLGKTRLI